MVLKAGQFFLGRAEKRSGEDQGNEEERFHKESGEKLARERPGRDVLWEVFRDGSAWAPA